MFIYLVLTSVLLSTNTEAGILISPNIETLLTPNELKYGGLSSIDDRLSQLYHYGYGSDSPIEENLSPSVDVNYGNLKFEEDRQDDAISSPVNNPTDFSLATEHIDDDLSKAKQNVTITDLVSSYLDTLTSYYKSRRDPDEHQYSSTSRQSVTAPSFGLNREYIDHPLALSGHQYVQGGAGEGKQLLGPDGTFKNIQVVKSDDAIPSYCDPPNPCPIGYTEKDSCLEDFLNLASFSREYQAKQQCTCDKEHSLFACTKSISTID